MTSSLPDFSASPASAPANDAASLAALFTDAGAEPGSDAAPEFAALMGASTAPSTAAAPAGVGGDQPAGAMGCVSAPTRMSGHRRSLPAMLAAAVPEEPTASAFGAKVAPTVPAIELVSSIVPLRGPAGPVGSREITRDMLEEAAAFAASLLQAALPGIQLPELLGLANDPASLVNGSAGNPAGTASLLPQAASKDPAAAQAMASAEPFTLAADGAIELKLDLAQLKPVEFQLDTAADQSLAISAELQRPGEVTVRLEAAGIVPAGQPPDALRTGGPVERAIFAAKYPGLKITVGTPDQPGERNFVFAGDKQVKSTSPVDGISVAKTETTMPVASEPRFSRNPESFSVLPQRAEFQVVVPTAERFADPAAAPAEQNFAARAVDTVTSLAETQFSASMQKAGSVQLRLRFGGEDLSVRVELRDGAVHTNFHTDSPELRSALAHEWQAVAAQSPEQMRRYLEPVFSPAPSSADTPSSFGRQPQHQPNQQSPQDQPSRSPRESWADATFAFSRRSQLSESFIPEPAASRGPALLPTSLRLSVHA